MTSALPQTAAVIGAGSWGTALAIALAQNLDKVYLWGRNRDDIVDMAAARCNRKYLPDADFPKALIPEPDFDRLASLTRNFLLVVPSHAFRQNLINLRSALDQQNISHDQITLVWGSKGLEVGSGKMLSEVVDEVFADTATPAVVSGPSFAAEVAQGMPTALTVASADEQAASAIAQWFRSPTTRVYYSTDIIGVQLGGTIKNVMAIAAGISDGLGYGANARAALITRGLTELTRLGVALGGKTDTYMGLTGVGDLILTCTDNQSRNRRFGLGIGAGKSMQQIIEEIGQEVEGVNTVRELFNKSSELDVDMPITTQVYKVLFEQSDPRKAVQQLLSRQPKSESNI